MVPGCWSIAMNKLTVLLCLITSPAFAADPPDWYAHIPAEQRAALVATRDVQRGHAALASAGVLGYRAPPSGTYSAAQSPAQFDASALVHPNDYSIDYHNLKRAIERRYLWQERQPQYGFDRWQRVGKHDRL